MEKVIRDGRVAVLYSPGWGAGWYTWNTGSPACLHHPEIVRLVEERRGEDAICEAAERLWGAGFYAGGAESLAIAWLPEGTAFRLDEHDGSERIITQAELDLMA